MWVYDLVFIWCAVVHYLKIDKKIAKIILMLLPLFCLAAFRSINMGNDTSFYHSLFLDISGMSYGTALSAYSNRFEPGFIILNKFLSYLSKDPQIIIITTTLIFYVSFFFLLKKESCNFFLSIFLFITMRYYFFFFGNIRQEIALSLTIFSYLLLKKNRIILPLVLIIMASLFHLSALSMLLLAVPKILKFNKKISIVFLLIAFVLFAVWNTLYPLISGLLPSRYQNYVNTSYYEEANNLANWLNFAIIIILSAVIFAIHRIKKTKRLDAIDTFVLAFSIFFSLLSTRFSMMSRYQYYFSIFFILLLPKAFKELKIEKRIALTAATIILFYSYHVIILLLRPEWQNVYPYEFYFQL